MTECDEITPGQADNWHWVSMRHLSDRQIRELLDWLERTEGGKFYWTLSKNFWFEQQEDHMQCVLAWK